MYSVYFIRLRLNTLQLAAGMHGKVNRAVVRQSKGGLGYVAIPLYTPQLAARSFINGQSEAIHRSCILHLVFST